MQDIMTMIYNLKRPPLLVRAAKFGVDDYQRDRHLPRALRLDVTPAPGQALLQLLEIERELETRRKAHHGDYTIARHVDVLVAIMAEARNLKATRPASVRS